VCLGLRTFSRKFKRSATASLSESARTGACQMELIQLLGQSLLTWVVEIVFRSACAQHIRTVLGDELDHESVPPQHQPNSL